MSLALFFFSVHVPTNDEIVPKDIPGLHAVVRSTLKLYVSLCHGWLSTALPAFAIAKIRGTWRSSGWICWRWHFDIVFESIMYKVPGFFRSDFYVGPDSLFKADNLTQV